MSVARTSARLRDSEPAPARARCAVKDTERPRTLTRREVELPDGRYLLAYGTERNDRTFLPTAFCPLCPTGDGGASEVPLDTFEVVVFENRFPAVGPDRRKGRPVRPPTTGCEVVVYTPEHKLTLAQLPADRVRLLVDVWADRYRELGSRAEVAYVYIFENKGEEVGVTLHHPHGQIYALPFIPPFAETELEASRNHLDARGQCLHCSELALEASGPRRLLDEGSMIAFV